MPYHEASIIFDLDGTLVDSAPDLLGATNHVMQHIGCSPVPMDVIHAIVGKGSKAMTATAAKANGVTLSDNELAELFPIFIDYYSKNIAVHSRPFEGVVENLRMIKDAGGLLGVCTNKKEALARQVLDELDLSAFFVDVVGADTLDVHKPHPDHLLGTIERVKGDRTKAVMIGDSAPDINAAKAAGVPVIGVTFGYTDKPVQELQPDAIMHTYEELPELLASFLKS